MIQSTGYIKHNFIFAISVEDIPPASQIRAELQWSEIFTILAKEIGLNYEIKVNISPHHMIIWGRLDEFVLGREYIGPNHDANEESVQSFIKKYNLKDCKVVMTDKGMKWHGIANNQQTEDIIPALCNQLVNRATWAYSICDWIRPALNCVCIFNEKHIEFLITKLQLQTESCLYCHPYLHNAKIELTSDPLQDLAKYGIITSFADKLHSADQQLQKLQSVYNKDLSFNEDYTELYHETLRIAHSPLVIICEISSDFLYLAPELLAVTITKNLKLIPCADRSKYIMIANAGIDTNIVRQNIESAISARLRDMEFFYNKDLSVPLSSHIDRLEEREFFPSLGSYKDKNVRICNAIQYFMPTDTELIEASKLVYSDLFTAMVEEFPELEGVMSYIYSEQTDVGRILKNAMWPRNETDSILRDWNKKSGILSWFKRLDTLVGFAIANKLPSGSRDPLGLRREAIGFVRIGFEMKPILNWEDIAKYFIGLYSTTVNIESIMLNLKSFIYQRISYAVKDFTNSNAILQSNDLIWNAQDKCSIDINPDVQKVQKRLRNLLSEELEMELTEIPIDLKSIYTSLISFNQVDNWKSKALLLNVIAEKTNKFLDNTHIETSSNKDLYNCILLKVLQATEKYAVWSK